MAIYKAEEWQDTTTKYWHCNDVSNLGKGSGLWTHPARILGMTPADYLQWVIDNYKPDRVRYSADASVVWFEWKSQAQMRKYKNFINAKARQVNYQI